MDWVSIPDGGPGLGARALLTHSLESLQTPDFVSDPQVIKTDVPRYPAFITRESKSFVTTDRIRPPCH